MLQQPWLRFAVVALVTPFALGANAQTPDSAAAGELWAAAADGTRRPLPVLDTDVAIDVAGILVHGVVRQRFSNPTDRVLEARYVFPLPEDAAVHEMEIVVGRRRIRSVVQEKQQARRIYERARAEGRKAAIVAQRRPNLFSTDVANINPGETVEVRLEYLDRVRLTDGAFHLRFPLTFTPRYGWSETEGHRTATPTASLTLRLTPGLPIEEPRSPSHAFERFLDGATWELAGTFPADRDVELSWRPLAGSRPGAALFVERRDGERFGMLLVQPPERGDAGPGIPTETVFVIDVSGSMSGEPIRQARAALAAALARLRPGDTFNVVRFASATIPLWSEVRSADAESVGEARSWVRRLQADGGTRILPALGAALDQLERDPGGRLQRIVFLTDGGVSNEREVFETIAARLGSIRIHTIGIGSAPNAYFMRRTAEFGHGTCAFVSRLKDGDAAIDALFRRIDRPAMSDLVVDWGGLPVAESYPPRVPDLYPGETLSVAFRLTGEGTPTARVALRGRIGDGPFETAVPLTVEATSGGVPVLWARRKVQRLMDGLVEGVAAERVRGDVIDVATAFGLVTAYTSRVAVEEFASAEGDAVSWQAAHARPAGSLLPQGGTTRTLRLLVAVVLAAGVPLLLGLRRLAAG